MYFFFDFSRQVESTQKSVKCRPNKKGLHETQGAGNKWDHYLYSTQCLLRTYVLCMYLIYTEYSVGEKKSDALGLFSCTTEKLSGATRGSG